LTPKQPVLQLNWVTDSNYWVLDCKIGRVIFKTAFSLLFGLSLSVSAQASALRCESIFESAKEEQTNWSGLRGDALRFEIENRIRQFAEEEMLTMSAEELSKLRSEAHKIGKKILGVEARNDFYKAANGSLRSRIIIEEANNMRRVRNELKRGSIDQAVEGMEFDFVQFEVNFLYIQALRDEMGQMVGANRIKSADFESRLHELKEAEKYFGKKFFKYQAMQNMIEEVKKSVLTEQRSYARKALQTLQNKARIEAAKQLLTYRKISLEEVERYADFSSVAKDSMQHKVAMVEFWTMIKMITLSGPIVKFAKAIVYKMPSKISLKPFRIDADIQPRQALSEALGIGHNQHLRDLYLEKIESIVALTDPAEQYELLKSLNAVSEKKDELLVTFARVSENQKVWLDIKAHAASLISKNNAFADDFHARMQASEKKAILDGPFPLYYNEAGISVAGKVATGGFALYMMVQHYLDTHPDAVNNAISVGEHALKLIAQ